jgi:hypothetical protein
MGRTKLIETPEKMWELFEAYVKDTKTNHRTVSEFHGKEGEERIKPLERPLSMAGFERYVFRLDTTAALGIDQYFANQDKIYDDYMGICRAIRNDIKADQIEGGMVGQYNASITQRLNNLTDKTEVTQKVEQPLFGNEGDDD